MRAWHNKLGAQTHLGHSWRAWRRQELSCSVGSWLSVSCKLLAKPLNFPDNSLWGSDSVEI